MYFERWFMAFTSCLSMWHMLGGEVLQCRGRCVPHLRVCCSVERCYDKCFR
jgi:hypothetical protein